jgi:hypothetical protein
MSIFLSEAILFFRPNLPICKTCHPERSEPTPFLCVRSERTRRLTQ